MSAKRTLYGVGGALSALFLCCCPIAEGVTITLEVSPTTPTSGAWAPGELVEIIIEASSDGTSEQGYAGADFKSGDGFGLTVADTGLVTIHDVLFFGSQVDTELDAGNYDGNEGYLKAEDTWFYDEYTDFVGAVDVSEAALKAVAGSNVDAYGRALGTGGTPVEFFHVVFEVQPGLDIGQSCDVTFKGQVMAYGVGAPGEISSNIFGSMINGGDVGEGAFALTRVPEPATALMLFAGLGLGFLRPLRRR